MNIVNLIVELTIAVFSVFGNVLVVLAVGQNRPLRTVTNFFLVSLALADFLVGLVAIPCALVVNYGHPMNDFYGCLILNCIVIILTQSSIFSLLSIAIERFVAVKHPLRYQEWFSKRTACGIIIISWFFAILIGLIPVFGWNLGRLQESGHCSFVSVISLTYMVYFNFFVCVLLPLIMLFVIYLYIFYIVRKQSQKIAALEVVNDTISRNNAKMRRNKKAAKSLAVVVGFFALCWLPLHILNTLTVVCPQRCSYPLQLLSFTIYLSHVNSAINPLLYALGNSGFRKAFHRLLCCRKDVQDSSAWKSATIYGNEYIVNGTRNSSGAVTPAGTRRTTLPIVNSSTSNGSK